MFECRHCNGEGELLGVACGECKGEGWVECDRGGINCPFRHCYCEAAWDRQQADLMSEPPMSASERHQMAWDEKQRLRR